MGICFNGVPENEIDSRTCWWGCPFKGWVKREGKEELYCTFHIKSFEEKIEVLKDAISWMEGDQYGRADAEEVKVTLNIIAHLINNLHGLASKVKE